MKHLLIFLFVFLFGVEVPAALLKQSTARSRVVFLTDSSDHVSGKTGLTLTITASKDGAAFSSITPTVTELSSGWYKLALTTSHTDTLGDFAMHITGTGADAADMVDQVVADLPGAAVSSVSGAVGSVTGNVGGNILGNVNGPLLGNVNGSVASVVGNIGGNVVGSVGSVTGLTASNLDATISSRLASASYTAPDNSTITTINSRLGAPAGASHAADIAAVKTDTAAVKLKTDNLPSDPASSTQVATRLASSSYTAPDNTSVTAIKAVTDLFTFQSGNVNARAVTVVDKTGYSLATAQMPVKKNTALANFQFPMNSSSTGAPATGLTVTCQRSIDGGSFASCTNSVTAIANGYYKVSFSAADLNGDTILVRFTATGAKERSITFVTQ